MTFIEWRPRGHVLAGKAANCCCYFRCRGYRFFAILGHGLTVNIFLSERQFSGIPPIQLRRILDSGVIEPLFISKRREEMCIRVLLFNLKYRGMRQVVVVAMRYDDNVYDGYILNLAWHRGKPRRPHE